MIYLDNAATSWPKPPEVLRARKRGDEPPLRQSWAWRASRVPVRRAGGIRLPRGGGQVSCCAPERVIFTLNCTDALNMAIRRLSAPGRSCAGYA